MPVRVLRGNLARPEMSAKAEMDEEGGLPPSEAAPSPKKQAATDRLARSGLRFRAKATPAACGI
jgi:hypothetical protein